MSTKLKSALLFVGGLITGVATTVSGLYTPLRDYLDSKDKVGLKIEKGGSLVLTEKIHPGDVLQIGKNVKLAGIDIAATLTNEGRRDAYLTSVAVAFTRGRDVEEVRSAFARDTSVKLGSLEPKEFLIHVDEAELARLKSQGYNGGYLQVTTSNGPLLETPLPELLSDSIGVWHEGKYQTVPVPLETTDAVLNALRTGKVDYQFLLRQKAGPTSR